MPEPVNQTRPAEVDGLRGRLTFWLRHDAARLLWPGTCLACGAPAGDGPDLCAPCFAALPWNVPACSGCALPLPLPLPASWPVPEPRAQPAPGPGHGDEAGAASPHAGAATIPSDPIADPTADPDAGPRCGACLGTHAPLALVHAACVYAAPLDRLLPRFKFHADLAAGALLAELMARTCAGQPRPAALLPLPLHRARLRRRGYDQALELARPLARALGLPLLADALLRTRATAPQSRLDADARRRNLRGAFAVRPGAAVPAHVALIDDVMTTGATLHAAAHALRQAGVARVDAWVCARVP